MKSDKEHLRNILIAVESGDLGLLKSMGIRDSELTDLKLFLDKLVQTGFMDWILRKIFSIFVYHHHHRLNQSSQWWCVCNIYFYRLLVCLSHTIHSSIHTDHWTLKHRSICLPFLSIFPPFSLHHTTLCFDFLLTNSIFVFAESCNVT